MRELFIPQGSSAEAQADSMNPLEKLSLADFVYYTFPTSMKQAEYDFLVHKVLSDFISPVLWVDMDGVLAKWDSEAKWSDICNPETHYFLKCKPDKQSIETVKKLLDDNDKKYDVAICSKVIGVEAAMDKSLWLAKRGLGGMKKLFVPYNEQKPICSKDFLLRHTKSIH